MSTEENSDVAFAIASEDEISCCDCADITYGDEMTSTCSEFSYISDLDYFEDCFSDEAEMNKSDYIDEMSQYFPTLSSKWFELNEVISPGFVSTEN